MRDDYLTVIDWQADVIRAGVGVGEVIARPKVVSPAARPSGYYVICLAEQR